MDYHNPNASDFIGNKGAVTPSPAGETGSHNVRRHANVALDSNDLRGQVVFTLPIDAYLDAASSKLAEKFQFYNIESITLDIQSASSLGTSSGGIQVCHIPDPYALDFSDTLPNAANVDKAVRQSGSVFVRPRESVPMTVKLDGMLYTQPGVDRRLYSYGAIVAVARVIPSAGDAFSYEITLNAHLSFTVPAFSVTTAVALTRYIVLADLRVKNNKIYCDLPFALWGRKMKISLIEPLPINAVRDIRGVKINMNHTFRKFTLQPYNPDRTDSPTFFCNLLSPRSTFESFKDADFGDIPATAQLTLDYRSRMLNHLDG